MKQVKLLDCTLRDGGYVNDWEFGHDNIVTIFERLISAGVDILEVGFLDDRRTFDRNRTIMPTTQCADQIFGKLDKGNTMIVAMRRSSSATKSKNWATKCLHRQFRSPATPTASFWIWLTLSTIWNRMRCPL